MAQSGLQVTFALIFLAAAVLLSKYVYSIVRRHQHEVRREMRRVEAAWQPNEDDPIFLAFVASKARWHNTGRPDESR